MIKHLVLSSGGPRGCMTFGAIKQLVDQKIISISQLHSLYGVSIGAIIGAMILFENDLDFVENYIIHKPWNKYINITNVDLFSLTQQNGIFDIQLIDEIILPILDAKGIHTNITLLEFFNHTHIHFYCYTSDIYQKNNKLIEMSHHSHPNLTLIEALHRSSCVPFLFKPIINEENHCYIDGAFLMNFPYEPCIQREKCNPNEIIGIYIMQHETKHIDSESSLFDVAFLLGTKYNHMIQYNFEKLNEKIDAQIIYCFCNDHSIWEKIIIDKDYRALSIQNGKSFTNLFILQNQSKPQFKTFINNTIPIHNNSSDIQSS